MKIGNKSTALGHISEWMKLKYQRKREWEFNNHMSLRMERYIIPAFSGADAAIPSSIISSFVGTQ